MKIGPKLIVASKTNFDEGFQLMLYHRRIYAYYN